MKLFFVLNLICILCTVSYSRRNKWEILDLNYYQQTIRDAYYQPEVPDTGFLSKSTMYSIIEFKNHLPRYTISFSTTYPFMELTRILEKFEIENQNYLPGILFVNAHFIVLAIFLLFVFILYVIALYCRKPPLPDEETLFKDKTCRYCTCSLVVIVMGVCFLSALCVGSAFYYYWM